LQLFDPKEGYLKHETHFDKNGDQDGTCTEWFDDEKVKLVEVWLEGKR
jgi:hypothetical protein